MTLEKSHTVTRLLEQWSEGDEFALDDLMPLIYDELRVMAKRHMVGQRKGHTFQTTELIHEAYVKLAKGEGQKWNNRAHFFGVASKAMRHILVDYARSKGAQKRGNAAIKVTFEDTAIISKDNSEQVLALDEALNALQKLDQRKSHTVEMKFFGGLTIKEIASVLNVSAETVKRDWRFSRTWLLNEIS